LPASVGATSSVPSPPVLQDPALYLPEASQQISRLVLRLSERRLYAYRGDRAVASYPVSVGRDDWETPTGEFTIFQRQQHPAWEHPLTGEVMPPGPDNPLGARWLGFWTDGTNAIGFHGTPQEHLIGQAVSHGCVRMRNADVIELYDLVELGTTVIVVP
jgi:lipoprotein-anchoring transpeptidase ErfK/SrfK